MLPQSHFCAAAAALLASPVFAQVVVTEYCSSNVESKVEVDGTSPDWIELWNSGVSTVNLAGWGLSDDSGDPFQWTFPDYFLGPNEYVVVFASGRDRRVTHNEYHTLITEGDDWRYAPGLLEPPSDWYTVNFNDSSFASGPSGFGYGDQDDNTWVNADSLYLRKTFQLPPNFADGISMAFLHMDVDDGYVAYLNGQEIARSNMGRPGDHPPFDQAAEEPVEAHLYRGWGLKGLVLEDFRDRFQPGKNVLALQVHNASPSGGDLTAIPMLSVGTTGPMYVDISRGRHPNGVPGQWYFAYATPGAANTDGAEVGFSSAVSMTPAPGQLASGGLITLSHSQPGAEIRYTLDGSEPTESSTLYTAPITRGGVFQIIRARAFEANLWPSWITTQSYFGNVPSDLPTFSLVTDPDHLWDPNLGIYEKLQRGLGTSSARRNV